MSEQEQGQQIMQMVNEITPAKRARLMKQLTEQAGGVEPVYLEVRQVAPALDMTVGFNSELAAYKLAYAFRDHSTAGATVKAGPNIPGMFLVFFDPRQIIR